MKLLSVVADRFFLSMVREKVWRLVNQMSLSEAEELQASQFIVGSMSANIYVALYMRSFRLY